MSMIYNLVVAFVTEVTIELKKYFHIYNTERPHESLEYQTPYENISKNSLN